MSYLTQMAGLAYHNFVSAAVGIALAIAFVRGIARRESKTIGNFWVDMTRSRLWVLLPDLHHLCAGPGLAGRGAELQAVRHREAGGAADRCQTTGAGRQDHRRRRLRNRPSRKGRSPRRKRSRCWAPTAADSSTPTARIRLRTPHRSPTSSRCVSIFAIPAGLNLHARPDDGLATPRLGGVGGDGDFVSCRRHCRVLG